MIRRLVVLTMLVGGGLMVAPVTSASATPLCEGVAYYGIVTAPVGDCIPYGGAVECNVGSVSGPVVGTLWHEECIPAL